MQFVGVEQLEESFLKGRSCGVFLGHYANWEWISSMPLWIDSKLCTCMQLYHPVENLVTDRLLNYTRQRFGGININAEHSVRHLVKAKREGTPVLLGFIADQSPVYDNIHYWADFLNHPETPFFTGAERIMQKFDMDVYYLDVRRISRGRYVAEYKKITDNPKSYKEFELTDIYIKMLETTIRNNPPYWLWSHKRWKRTKQEWILRKQHLTSSNIY